LICLYVFTIRYLVQRIESEKIIPPSRATYAIVIYHVFLSIEIKGYDKEGTFEQVMMGFVVALPSLSLLCSNDIGFGKKSLLHKLKV
jgi:hypothetical protein